MGCKDFRSGEKYMVLIQKQIGYSFTGFEKKYPIANKTGKIW
jgi:hypothetical protein